MSTSVIIPPTRPRMLPSAPHQSPCSESVRRSNPSSAPFADNWPSVTSCRRAPTANAPEMTMPTIASATSPPTRIQFTLRFA